MRALWLVLILVAFAASAQTGGRVANMKPRPGPAPVATKPTTVTAHASVASAPEPDGYIFSNGFEGGSGGAPVPDVNACKAIGGALLPGIQPPQLVAITKSWQQAFSAPACVNPRDPRCKQASYPRSIGTPVPLGAPIGGYTVIPFVPVANQTVTLSWDQVQSNSSIGYPKPRPADSMFIAISPCPGDLRAPSAGSPVPWLQNGCRRAGGGASIVNSTLPGASTEYVCRLIAGQTYYYTVAPYSPPNLIVDTCSNPANGNSDFGCDVQAISSGQ